jgi:superfamily II DNA or RNA helicase
MDIVTKYNIYIQQKYKNLIDSEKEIDNFDLAKIFEYFCAIQLSKQFKHDFFEYNDIDPNFKEENKLTRTDTGIDLCDLKEIIVQCKLRKTNLTFLECATFFASQVIYDGILKKPTIKWPKLIIARNKESKLSNNLKEKHELFTDITFSRDEIISYCDNLLKNPIKIKKEKEVKFKLRDYQIEAIKTINDNKNSVICLPTGCGKNSVMIYSMDVKKRYLILVPRIILMEQFKEELIKHKPELKNRIQTIGDDSNDYDKKKTITICVYNSISLIEKYCDTFDKIFIDEAHHINSPEIYEIEKDDEDEIEDEYNEDEEKENIIKDDSEDEIKNTSGFNKIIKSLSKYNNNVYLSATIDKIDGFAYYCKDIRDMIESKYLSDYTINIPIFSDDPTNKNICQYLIRNYRNVILYCNSQKEGKKINELLNSIQKGVSKYIDCNTSRKQRNDIIDSYKNDKIAFLVNVRILVEGFDAPITKGVCFIHLPSSKTTAIQIIGRALRLHPLKTIANIILPFSNKDDELSINKFLHILANNDRRIRKSYINKINGGYIGIEKVIDDNEKDNDKLEYRYDMVYDSMGSLINGKEIWMKKLEWVMNYIDKYEKRPAYHDKDKEVNKYGGWLIMQVLKYNRKQEIMKNEEIRKIWNEFVNNEKYKKYFICRFEQWKINLEKVKKYINENKKRPSKHDYNNDIKILGQWIDTQLKCYKKNHGTIKNEEIRELWIDFINKYKKYFMSNEEEWKYNLKEVKKYIDKYKKRPSSTHNNKEIQFLGRWLVVQTRDYGKKDGNKILTINDNIRKIWKNFINEYKEYFISNDDIWKLKLLNVKKYIDENKKRPSTHDNNNDIKILGNWIDTQLKNYTKKKEIMKNDDILKLWKEFINDPKYSVYFK